MLVMDLIGLGRFAVKRKSGEILLYLKLLFFAEPIEYPILIWTKYSIKCNQFHPEEKVRTALFPSSLLPDTVTQGSEIPYAKSR
ncbi:hypothetical protein D3C87_1987180 [compost metagenome]